MPTAEELGAKRSRLLDMAREIPERCRLVEQSPGAPAWRRLRKLRLFGRRYVTWALNRIGWLRSGEVGFSLFFGKPMRLPFKMEDDFVTLYLTGALGGPEYKLTRFFLKNLKPTDVFYDVGASYGFYTFLAAEFLSPERIHCFEPLPEIYRSLSYNCVGPEHANNLALWDKSGRHDIHLHYLGHGFSTLEPEMVAIDPPRASGRISVQCMTLDEYAKTHAAPTIMKVDIEGAEEKFIAGGRSCLSTARPVVSMEVIAGAAGKRLSLRALEKMLGLGYHSFALTETGELAGPLSAGQWSARLERMAQENAADQIAWDNVIFQKPSWSIPPAAG